MKENNNREEHQVEVVDVDYVGIVAFLVFLAVLWQNSYYTNFEC